MWFEYYNIKIKIKYINYFKSRKQQYYIIE